MVNKVQDIHNEENNQMESTKQSGIRLKPLSFVLVILLTILVTAFITNLFLNKELTNNEPNTIVDSSTTAEERDEFEKLYNAFDKLNLDYYKEVDPTVLIDGAIDGMLDSLEDPYTDYLTKQEATNFNDSISSSFEGIGAEISSVDGNITVVSPIKGAPAEAAGIRANDVILTVDGTNITGMSTTEAVTLIRGEKGSEVVLTVRRPGVEEVLTIPIIRDTIPVETVYGEMVTDEIAKIQVTSFSKNTTKELKEMMTNLEKEGMKSLILDLRQNPGGLLDQALEMASLFMDNDKTVLFVENRDGTKYNYVSSGDKKDIELVVLIDEGSASASEIVAGALSQNANVPLVGKTTFGKGTVQQAFEFEDGSSVKLTTQRWLTPNGDWINEVGIKPDYEVSLPEYAFLTVISTNETYKVDDFNSQVKVAQAMLNALGYTVREDGYFDDAMQQQVKNFQKDNNLTVDGILTGSTSAKLMDEIRTLIKENDTQLHKAIEVLENN